jgi:hypothetical protein
MKRDSSLLILLVVVAGVVIWLLNKKSTTSTTGTPVYGAPGTTLPTGSTSDVLTQSQLEDYLTKQGFARMRTVTINLSKGVTIIPHDLKTTQVAASFSTPNGPLLLDWKPSDNGNITVTSHSIYSNVLVSIFAK